MNYARKTIGTLVLALSIVSVHALAQDKQNSDSSDKAELEHKLDQAIEDEKNKEPGDEVGESSYNIEDCQKRIEQGESAESSEEDVIQLDLDTCIELVK